LTTIFREIPVGIPKIMEGKRDKEVKETLQLHQSFHKSFCKEKVETSQAQVPEVSPSTGSRGTAGFLF
jgi:hypothetical protein